MNRFDFLEFKSRAKPPADAMPAELKDGPSYYRAARGMRASGHFYPAAQLYERALGFQEHHHPTWVELIDSLVRADRLDDADQHSRKAIAAYGQVRVFYAARALVLAYRGRLRDAMNHVQTSLEGEGGGWYARCVQAELLVQKATGNAPQAVALLEEAADLAEDTWEVYFLGGWAFLRAGLPTLAAGLLADAAHFNPKAPVCWIALGDAFRALRLYDQAIFYYRCATELEPDNDIALKRQAAVAPRLFGLMQTLFSPADLRHRWKKRLEQLGPR